METVKWIFELLYYVSGILLTVIAIIGLYQIKLSSNQVKVAVEQFSLIKHDIESKYKRESIEKTIEFIEKYKDTILNKCDSIINVMEQKKYPYYKGDISKFSFKNKAEQEQYINRAVQLGISEVFNELELFSAAFVSELADEKLAFQSLGLNYVTTISLFYGYFTAIRLSEPYTTYTNIAKLFDIWKDRLKSMEIEREIKHLNIEKDKLEEKEILPVGTTMKKN